MNSGIRYRDLFPARVANSPIPPRLPVLRGSQLRGDWWPGVSRRCLDCGGHLTAGGQTIERDSEISCLLCARVAYDVRWDQ